MTLFEAIIIAIVEGLTEFLPVSSTGHMIITSSLMNIHTDSFTKLFTISIQLGAIIAVVVLYWRKFFDFTRWQFYIKLAIAIIPAIILGLLFSDAIDAMLESPTTVAIMLIIGGFILLFIDRAFTKNTLEKEEEVTFKKAFITGAWQCLAMIPGVSRSAASIIGGMQQGMTRKLAAEFSFFLAVPTMCAATAYRLYEGVDDISSDQVKLLLVGNLVAFLVAMAAIKFFISYLQKYGFRLFGWYRIIAGIILLILIFTGVIIE